MNSGNPYEAFTFSDFVECLSPSFVSVYFLIFVLLVVLLYYLIPKRFRWTVLLTGSALFYSLAGLEPLITVLLSSVLVYFSGIMIERTDKSRKHLRRVWLAAGVLSMLAVLIFCKCYSLFEWSFNFIIPLGISYYTFSSVGYLADIYWGKEAAEKNVLRLALFLLFFPKILQGPIAKHRELAPQLNEGHEFNWHGFCFGIQKALWGYFKKMVVADRLGTMTRTVFGNYQQYGGALLFLTMLAAAFQLYCDFSGCMDIAEGISQMLGIKLEKNFDHPFLSRSGAEFWQRWHMTLSGWFKDYLFLPVSRSKWVKNLSKKIGERFGAQARKNTMILISSFFVWVATGLWHGTGLPYLLWGLYWYVIISSSTLLADKYGRLTRALHINTENSGWRLFQMARTYLIFSFGRLITIPNDLEATGNILGRFFSDARPWELFDKTLYSLGLIDVEFYVMLTGIIIVWAGEVLRSRGSVRERIAGWNIPFRCAFYSLSVIVILVFGIYGGGHGNTTFLYMNF